MGDDVVDEPGDDASDLRVRADLVVAVLNAIGVVLAIAWLWNVVRAEQNVARFAIYGGDGAITFVQRIDIALQSMNLLAYAAVVGGLAQIVALLTHRHDA